MNEQTAAGIPAVFMRGGTSKGVFFHERDLPAAGAERDDVLLRVMGTPDPLQIDGLGGTTSSTSKVMVVGEPDDAGTVPYSFAQVGIGDAVVDWRGNCGNLTFAVARFAVEEGLAGLQHTLLNTNTGVRITADLSSAEPVAMPGVPGVAPAVTTSYLDPAGAALGSLLPLGSATTVLDVPGVGRMTVSLVDATNPYLFVSLDAVRGAERDEAELRADAGFLELVERIRATAAVAAGAAPSLDVARRVASVTPRIVLVSPGDGESDVAALTISMQQVHRGIPMTAAMCLAAARATAGTVVADLAGVSTGETRVRHPLGISRVRAETRDGSIYSVGLTGTARTLMRGIVYPC